MGTFNIISTHGKNQKTKKNKIAKKSCCVLRWRLKRNGFLLQAKRMFQEQRERAGFWVKRKMCLVTGATGQTRSPAWSSALFYGRRCVSSLSAEPFISCWNTPLRTSSSALDTAFKLPSHVSWAQNICCERLVKLTFNSKSLIASAWKNSCANGEICIQPTRKLIPSSRTKPTWRKRTANECVCGQFTFKGRCVSGFETIRHEGFKGGIIVPQAWNIFLTLSRMSLSLTIFISSSCTGVFI